MDYVKQHGDKDAPSLWFIEQTIRNAGLQTKRPKKRQKGGSAYLLYPTQAIRDLGTIQQSADFIGKKYIAGRTEPVHIFSSSYYTPFKLYQIARIPAETARCAIAECRKLWRRYPIPNVFRIDNGLQFRGTARGKRAIGMFLRFLLNLGVIPLFGAPSKPWTNPHVEGHNRVFGEKVWGQNHFTSLAQIDRECARFNQESIDLFDFRYANALRPDETRYLEPQQRTRMDRLLSVRGKSIYFTRFVESFEEEHDAHVIILNESVTLPEKYNHQFVFVEWNLEKEQLNIYSENQKILSLIKRIRFRINL